VPLHDFRFESDLRYQTEVLFTALEDSERMQSAQAGLGIAWPGNRKRHGVGNLVSLLLLAGLRGRNSNSAS
jgi:hypothetical protein